MTAGQLAATLHAHQRELVDYVELVDYAVHKGQAPPPLPTAVRRMLGPIGTASSTASDDNGRGRLLDGAAFILDAPALPPAIWGRDGNVLWAEGEPCLLVGPVGVGKTTLTGQIVRARLGIGDGMVLGYPVKAGGRLLYLACDRPPQIGRSMGRMFTEEDRPALEERLAVWPGPPPADLARNPGLLLQLARDAGADTVVIDSLKDAAIGLSDDEVGAGLNQAFQTALVGGVQVFGMHHQTKRGAGGTGPPDTLADVYGSVWITAGAGSVILLWGQAGDPVVALRHLKHPVEEIGPLNVLHDHAAGRTDVWHSIDLPSVIRAQGAHGLAPRAAAVAMFTTNEPSSAQVEKARRKLDRLVTDGLATHRPGGRGGGADRASARYFLAAAEGA